MLTNVRAPKDVIARASVRDAIAKAESELGPHGRVLVRPSGTEPLVRVMVEAPDGAVASELAGVIAGAIEREAS